MQCTHIYCLPAHHCISILGHYFANHILTSQNLPLRQTSNGREILGNSLRESFWGEEEKTHHVYSCIYVCMYLLTYLLVKWSASKKNQKNPYNNYWTQIVVYLFRWCTSFPICRSSLTAGCYISPALLIFICLALIDICVYKPWSFLLSSWDVLYSFTFFRI